MPDPTITKCPIHNDNPVTGCPNCILYMKAQGYFVERGLFIKSNEPPPKVNITPIEPKPVVPSSASVVADPAK